MLKTVVNYITIMVLSLVFMVDVCTPQQDSLRDAWGEMLFDLGLDETDLGFKPKGYWTRYPDPNDIPYKAPAFDGLFAEPQSIYDFVRVMALSVEDYLHPDYLEDNSNGLLKTAYYCGVRNATAQFRDYSASLWAEIDETEPMLAAVREIYRVTGTVYRYNAMGKASDFPLIEGDLKKALEPIDIEVQNAVAKTVLHLLHAHRFVQIGTRNIDPRDALDCWRIRRLGETQFDALEYFPQIEDCARNLDFNSLYYAGYKLLETSERLAKSLSTLKTERKIDWKAQNLNIVTPIGRIVIAGTGRHIHEYSDALLVVDLGGKDVYRGAAGSTPSLNFPVSLTIDLAGDDEYINEEEYLPAQGAAILGAAMLLDVAGDDKYQSKRLSQGAAMLGIGILADLEGDDEYRMWTSGQGAAYFGVGLAIDNRGSDRYYIHGDGQGYGGVGGVGTLVNRSGKDHYRAEPLAEKVFRPDYHSKEGKLNYSYAQGCGVGRRGDITDGHSWAGGMGTLIDLSGDDLYESANWSLGCGYWYGMGFIYDGGGGDVYRSAGWTQAAGAHFCIGALIDEGGDDRHECWAEQSSGIAFGHDYTIALFLNRGGNDVYRLKDDGLGNAINMSQIFFFDTGGNDEYITSGIRNNYGRNNYKRFNPPILAAFPTLYSNQICLFADAAGQDSYKTENPVTGKLAPDKRMGDGVQYFFPLPSERDSLSNRRYFGLAQDFESWRGPEIEFFRDKMKKRHKEFKE